MATGDFTTLAKVRAHLGLKSGDTDAVLRTLITAASAWMKTYLNRAILEATYTQTFDGNNQRKLFLPEYPVTQVTSVAIGTRVLESSEWVLSGNSVALLNGARFPAEYGNVQVVWNAGYPSVPADLDQACIEMVAWRFKERSRIGQSSVNVNGEQITFQTEDAPANVKTLMRNWRKVVPA